MHNFRIPTNTVEQYELAKYVRDKLFTKWLARSFAEVGHGTIIRVPARIGGAENIRLGRMNHIGPNCWIASIEGGRLTIGNSCYLPGSATIAAYLEIEIGNAVGI